MDWKAAAGRAQWHAGGQQPRGLHLSKWLAALEPQLVLLPVAMDGHEGCLDPALLVALQGGTLSRTDRNTWVEIVAVRLEM